MRRSGAKDETVKPCRPPGPMSRAPPALVLPPPPGALKAEPVPVHDADGACVHQHPRPESQYSAKWPNSVIHLWVKLGPICTIDTAGYGNPKPCL